MRLDLLIDAVTKGQRATLAPKKGEKHGPREVVIFDVQGGRAGLVAYVKQPDSREYGEWVAATRLDVHTQERPA